MIGSPAARRRPATARSQEVHHVTRSARTTALLALALTLAAPAGLAQQPAPAPAPASPALPGRVLALDAGSEAAGNPALDGWTADVGGAYFRCGDGTGSTATGAADVSVEGVETAAPPAVYRTDRYCPAGTPGGLVFQARTSGPAAGTVAIEPGTYTVRLHWAETYHTAAGKRQFDVSINGQRQGTSPVDVFQEAGGGNRALVRDYPGVEVSDAGLTVALTSVVADPNLAGLELIRTR
jgi:hypothetical protein